MSDTGMTTGQMHAIAQEIWQRLSAEELDLDDHEEIFQIIVAGAASSLEAARCPSCGGKQQRDTGINWCCKDAFHESSLEATPPQSELLKALQYRGITYCADLAKEGTPWESAAEPEPQYFETLDDAIGFQLKIAANDVAAARTQEIVAHIDEVTGPTGGWLDSPKHLKEWIERQYGSTK